MKTHITHFDDCGCRSAKFETKLADLETENARLREAIDAAMSELVIDNFDLAYDILEQVIRILDVIRKKAV